MVTKQFDERKKRLLESFDNSEEKLRIKKTTSSNLFRYDLQKRTAKSVSLKEFNHILSLEGNVLDVEGLTTYETIVRKTLEHNLLPSVAPELKHITIGGAIVGIGIESTCFREGFVHQGLLEAEVLLPDGRIVVCTAENEYKDLFHSLPNSYGTLGYILRAKIKLIPASKFVQIQVIRCNNIDQYLKEMEKATQSNEIRFIEGLLFSSEESYVMLGKFVDTAPILDDIYRSIFYRLVREKKEIYLTTEDYIFRYDPDWFWNIPETPFYQFFRAVCPKRWRNSGFYKKYMDFKKRLRPKFGRKNQGDEPLIQDWQVPWDRAADLISFALKRIDLGGKPWAGLPIKPFPNATLYPMKECPFYFNLGCYTHAKRQSDDPFYATKLIDDYCFGLGGLKMLYSSSFLSKEQFDAIYNGAQYRLLKQKYDPKKRLSDLYEKAVIQ